VKKPKEPPPFPEWMQPGHYAESPPSHEVYICTRAGKWTPVRAERDIDEARKYVDDKCRPFGIRSVIVSRTTSTVTHAREVR